MDSEVNVRVPPRRYGRASGLLHAVASASQHTGTAVSILGAVVLVNVLLIGSGYPADYVPVVQVTFASITLGMVFLIQHTQHRQEEVTQRKLDELLRSQPGADDRLVSLEVAPTEQIESATVEHAAVRTAAGAPAARDGGEPDDEHEQDPDGRAPTRPR